METSEKRAEGGQEWAKGFWGGAEGKDGHLRAKVTTWYHCDKNRAQNSEYAP